MVTEKANDISEKRKRLGMTQKELADAIGLSKFGDRTIRRWESGDTDIPGPSYLAIMSFPENPPFENNNNGRYKMIDLFAGIGGTRLGFYQTDAVDVVFSSEWDKFAQKTYYANFGEVPAGDITKIEACDIPDHDILVGGFPCVAFSRAGKRRGFEDSRGTLFFDIARILKEKKPSCFLLENVKNLVGHDEGRTIKTILEVLDDLDYRVFYKVLCAKDFGVPQNRERIYLVGFRKDIAREDAFDFPEPSYSATAVSSILEKNPDDKYTISDKLWQGHQRRKVNNKKMGKGFGYGIVNNNSKYTNTISARYYKDGSEILVEQKGKNPRKITPREAARLQGFPEEFIIPVSDCQAYKQFGNSVAVPVVHAIAENMISLLDDVAI